MFAKIKPAAIAIAAVVLIGGGIYTKVYLPKITYPSVSPQEGELTESISGVGTIEAKEIVVLAPKTTSKIGMLYADEGDRIAKGAVLARMELSELAGNKTENTALIEKNRSQMEVQKGVIEDWKARADLADATLKRYQSLFAGGYVTRSELDGAHSSARSAHAQLESAQAALQLLRHEIERAQGSLSALDAKISDQELRSPINGIVISREAEKGSTVGAGTAVFKIADPATVWIKIYVDERQASGLKIGQSGDVTLRSTGERRWPATVRRIGMQSDRITEERVVYLSLHEMPYPLYLGEQAEARIVTAHHPKALIIPSAAIVHQENQSGVLVEKEGRALFRPLTIIARSLDGNTAISGLDKESRVILRGERPLKAGDKVRL